MNENDLYRSFLEIDDDILERSEGMTKKSRKNSWIKWAVMAACFGLIMLVGIIGLYMDSRGKFVYVDENSTYGMIQKLGKRYNKTAIEESREVGNPEEDTMLYEQCIIVEFNETNYFTQVSSKSTWGVLTARVEESLLGNVIGTCKAKISYNTYMDEILTVREIKFVSSDIMIAVEMEGFYFVFCNKSYSVANLGELLESYGLSEVLEWNRFELKDEYYALDEDDTLWEMLRMCSDAKFVWGTLEHHGETICFTATSESLGIYKKEFSVSADGYISTNIFIHDGAFFIGEEAAKEIISYAKEHSQRAGYEPYRYTFAGTLEEVGEDYILMNDSLLCKNLDDGKTFRIETDDVWFRRYFESGYLKVGDEFILEFSGELDIETETIKVGRIFSVTPAKVVLEKSEGWMSKVVNKIYLKWKYENDIAYRRYINYLSRDNGSAG